MDAPLNFCKGAFMSINVISQDSYKDPRDLQQYGVVKIGGNLWMTKDLNAYCAGSLVTQEKPGRSYYNKTHLGYAAPEGWRIPTVSVWKNLFKSVGNDINVLNNAGLNLLPNGGCEPVDNTANGHGYNLGTVYYLTSNIPTTGILLWKKEVPTSITAVMYMAGQIRPFRENIKCHFAIRCYKPA